MNLGVISIQMREKSTKETEKDELESQVGGKLGECGILEAT